MEILKIIKKLESSKEFNSWKSTHQKAHLAHLFRMLDEANKNLWQMGYFNPETNLITVFVVNGSITKNPDAEVFKEQEKMVNVLDINSVKVDENQALEAANKILAENYRSSSVFKSFMILQNIEKIGQVWNISFVTQQFKTINVKIDAENGSCKSHKLISLIQGKE